MHCLQIQTCYCLSSELKGVSCRTGFLYSGSSYSPSKNTSEGKKTNKQKKQPKIKKTKTFFLRIYPERYFILLYFATWLLHTLTYTVNFHKVVRALLFLFFQLMFLIYILTCTKCHGIPLFLFFSLFHHLCLRNRFIMAQTVQAWSEWRSHSGRSLNVCKWQRLAIQTVQGPLEILNLHISQSPRDLKTLLTSPKTCWSIMFILYDMMICYIVLSNWDKVSNENT